MSNMRVIACNIRTANKAFVAGAACYVRLINIGNGCDRMNILGRSRSGRWVDKWEPLSNLKDFRFKDLPAEHPRSRDQRMCEKTERDLQAVLSNVQAHGIL